MISANCPSQNDLSPYSTLSLNTHHIITVSGFYLQNFLWTWQWCKPLWWFVISKQASASHLTSRRFKMSRTTRVMTQRHIPHHFNPQEHRCKDLTSPHYLLSHYKLSMLRTIPHLFSKTLLRSAWPENGFALFPCLFCCFICWYLMGRLLELWTSIILPGVPVLLPLQPNVTWQFTAACPDNQSYCRVLGNQDSSVIIQSSAQDTW